MRWRRRLAQNRPAGIELPLGIWRTTALPLRHCGTVRLPKIIQYRFVHRKVKFSKTPKAPGQARGHTDHKLTMGLAHNIARHMFTPAMPYDQVLGVWDKVKVPFYWTQECF